MGWGVACFGIFRGQILFRFFFTFFLNIFKTFFIILFVLWWNFITICSTFTHSFTQFFHVLWGSVIVGWCAFWFLGLRRAGFGATCVG